MRRFHGLEHFHTEHPALLQPKQLSLWLLEELQACRCLIFGAIGDDERILLAELALAPEGLAYDRFDQRIDLSLAGPILRADCVPLTYRLQGRVFAVSGRCSVLRKVCGVDLYLSHSYTGKVGDMAWQYFAIPVKPLLGL